MKILKYLAFALAGVLMASCDEDFDDWASPQSYPQEEAVTIPGYTASEAEGAVIDMAQAPANVKIVNLTGEALPEGFTLQNIRLVATPEGVEEAKETEIDLANDGTVDASVLDALTAETFGRRPVQRVFNCKVLVDAVKNGQAVLIDAGSIKVKVTPVAYGEYFYEIGAESNWSLPHALYGPNYDGKYQGYYWLEGEFKFKPNKDNWEGDYEYAGDNKIADIGGANCPNPGAGFYQIDVDLQEGTYNLTKVESITCVGNHNGWNQADAAQHMTYNSAEGCWELTTTLTNGFKFAMNDAWTVSWGGANGDPTAYDNITQNGGKDLNAPDGDGVYSIKLYLSYEGANRVVLVKQ